MTDQAAEKPKRAPLTSVKSLGISHDKNSRYRRTMEDAHIFVDKYGGVDTQGYFAVYDGHGGRGAVEFVEKNLHENVLAELNKDPSKPLEALVQGHLETDKQIAENKIQYSGTTTVVALIRIEEDGTKKLYAANAGDARAVLCRGGKAIRLTKDHKGNDEEEIERINKAGGFVVMHRVNGVLAVTRSLGDIAMKAFVTGEPYTREETLTEEDTHLILACDGIWDVISDQESCDIVAEHEACSEASRALMITSLKKGSTDNISVMVIKL